MEPTLGAGAAASEFLSWVMEELEYEGGTAAVSFLSLLKDLKNNSIDSTGVVTRVKELFKRRQDRKTTLDEVFNELRGLFNENPDLAKEFSKLKILSPDQESQSDKNSCPKKWDVSSSHNDGALKILSPCQESSSSQRNAMDSSSQSIVDKAERIEPTSQNSYSLSSSESKRKASKPVFAVNEVQLLCMCTEKVELCVRELCLKISDGAIDTGSRDSVWGHFSSSVLKCFRLVWGRNISAVMAKICNNLAAGDTLQWLLDRLAKRRREWSSRRDELLSKPYDLSRSESSIWYCGIACCNGIFPELLPPRSSEIKRAYRALPPDPVKDMLYSSLLSHSLQRMLMEPIPKTIHDMSASELNMLTESVEGTITNASKLWANIPSYLKQDGKFVIKNYLRGEPRYLGEHGKFFIENYLTERDLCCIKNVWGHCALYVLKKIASNAHDTLPLIVTCLRLKRREWTKYYETLKRSSEENNSSIDGIQKKSEELKRGESHAASC